MASKVNIKFVIALVAGLSFVGCGAVALAFYTIKKGPQQNIKLSEELEAKGDYEGAQRAMSRAVNKDPNNPVFLRRWLELLSKTRPDNQLNYREHLEQYYSIRRRLSEVEAINVKAQREFLDERLSEFRRGGADATSWGVFAGDIEKIIEKFPVDDKAREELRRYRGLAHLAQMSMNFEMSDAERQAVKDDLEAAIKADPADQLAVAGLADWNRLTARTSMQIKDTARCDQLLAEAKSMLDKFIAEHPPAPYAISSVFEIEVLQLFLKPPPNSTALQLWTSMQPRAQQLLDAVKTADPATLDDGIVGRAVDFGLRTGIKDAADQGTLALDRMLGTRPNYAWYMLSRASISMYAGNYDEAITRLQNVIDLPDLPVSPEGWALLKVRDAAAAQQVTSALAKWDAARIRLATNPRLSEDDKTKLLKDMTDALATADQLYEKTKNRTNIEERARKLMRGRLAYAHNDFVEARRELNDYVNITQRTDVQAMMLLADIMRRQDTIGEAKSLYERVLEIDRSNMMALLQLGDVEFRLNNLRRTVELYETAYRLDPSNTALKEQIDRYKEALAGKDSTNPVIAALKNAEDKLNQAIPDTAGAVKDILAVEGVAKDARQHAMLATALARMSQTEEAMKFIDRSLVKYKDDPVLTDLKRKLSSANPLDDALKLVDAEATLSPENKMVQRYLLVRKFGRNDLAEKYLEELTKLSPENPLVIGAQFDRAIMKRDLVEAARVAELAKKNNTDRLNGLIFELQLLAAQDKMKEATAAAQRATELDALNPAAWRMLGQMQLQSGQLAAALNSLERAMQISPTDSGAINLYIQALIASNRAREALDFCRDKAQLGTSDAAFVNQWLTLEFELGDKEKAIERRARIFAANPSNTQNGIELARNAVMARRTDQAEAVVAKLKSMDLSAAEQVPLTALEAAVLSLKKDQAGAMAAFDKLVATVPEAARAGRVHAGFAHLMLELNDFPFAEQVLLKGQTVEPKDELPATRELAEMYFSRGMFDKSLPLYETIYAVDANGNLGRRLAENMLRANKSAEANTLLTKLAAESKAKNIPADAPLLLLSVEAAIAAGDMNRAGTLLDEAVAAAPQNAMPRFRRAQFKAANPALLDAAIDDLEQVLKIDAKYPGARSPLATFYLRKNDLSRATSLLREGLTLEPKNVELRVTLVRMLVANGQTGPALVELAEGKKQSPDELSWPNITGEIFMIQGNFAGAASEFKTVWEKNKNPVNANNYIDALVRKSPADLETARKVLAEPALKTESHAGLLICRAMINRLDKRPDEMKNDLKAALRVIKSDEINQCNDVLILCSQKLFPTTDEMLTVFKEIAPPGGYTEAMRLQLAARGAHSPIPANVSASVDDLVKLSTSTNTLVAGNACRLAGEAKYREKKYEEAERLWRRSLELMPNHPESLNNLAYLLSKHLNRASEALPLAEKAVQLAPDKTNIIDTLGQVYLALGDLDKADQFLTALVAATGNPIERAAPLIHLIEVKLRKKDRPAADGLNRDLQSLINSYPEIKTRYQDELDNLKKLIESPN